jgi:hypothetical protein
MEAFCWWPLRNGRLGLCMGWNLSNPKDELRRPFSSPKCPDLFSRNVVVRAKPESLREMGVVGMGGNLADAGDTEDCGLVFDDLLVPGRSDLPLSTEDTVKALNTGGFERSG